jgi:hypothetical protein
MPFGGTVPGDRNPPCLSIGLSQPQWNFARTAQLRISTDADRCGMTRYFFDYTTQGRSIYDYRGDSFLNSDGACEFAEVIALDLKHSPNNEWVGWSIEVRNAAGTKFLSLPVENAELMAA